MCLFDGRDSATWFAGMVALLVGLLPYIEKYLRTPNMVIDLYGPREVRGNKYWLIRLENFGEKIDGVQVFCTGYRMKNQDWVMLPRVRLEWPFEVSTNSNSVQLARNFTGGEVDYCDLFSSENGGKLHLVLQPLELKFEDFIAVKIEVYAEHFKSKQPLLVEFRNTDQGWLGRKLEGCSSLRVTGQANKANSL